MFCMFLIFGAVVSYAWIGMLGDIMFLSSGVNELTNNIQSLNDVKANLTRQLTQLSKEEKDYATSLSIMQQELPTMEIFESIDNSIIKGVILSSLAITQKELKLNGLANTEDNIVTATRNLLDSGAFNVAQVPVVTRSNMGPEGLKFSLSLEPKPIGESGRR